MILQNIYKIDLTTSLQLHQKYLPLIVIKNIGSETKGATPEFILERVILKIDDKEN